MPKTKSRSEPHEIRGPYEAFVVAAKRKDGKCPDLRKALCSHADGAPILSWECPIMLFDIEEAAHKVCRLKNKEYEAFNVGLMRAAGACKETPAPAYAVFRVQVTFMEQVLDKQ